MYFLSFFLINPATIKMTLIDCNERLLIAEYKIDVFRLINKTWFFVISKVLSSICLCDNARNRYYAYRFSLGLAKRKTSCLSERRLLRKCIFKGDNQTLTPPLLGVIYSWFSDCVDEESFSCTEKMHSCFSCCDQRWTKRLVLKR